ncbi:MAG: tRNA (guanosine(46)-N7)-methyltransferase TrmB [Sphaerochaetaceae bacterium]
MKEELPRVDSPLADGKRGVKSYVLRAGKMTPYQKRALELYATKHAITFDAQKHLDLHSLFGNTHKTVIEIGFGMGESTAAIALQFPQLNFIGIEVFINGYAKLLHRIEKLQLTNVKVIRFDAVEFLQSMIKDESIDGFHIFFPDPWPKKKHHKRRLIQLPFAQLLTDKLVPGGSIYCVTDWAEYAFQMLDVFGSVNKLHNPHDGFAPPLSWRPTTGFERKGRAKEHEIFEIRVEKKGAELPL